MLSLWIFCVTNARLFFGTTCHFILTSIGPDPLLLVVTLVSRLHGRSSWVGTTGLL
jgi:hypothetical protein